MKVGSGVEAGGYFPSLILHLSNQNLPELSDWGVGAGAASV